MRSSLFVSLTLVALYVSVCVCVTLSTLFLSLAMCFSTVMDLFDGLSTVGSLLITRNMRQHQKYSNAWWRWWWWPMWLRCMGSSYKIQILHTHIWLSNLQPCRKFLLLKTNKKKSWKPFKTKLNLIFVVLSHSSASKLHWTSSCASSSRLSISNNRNLDNVQSKILWLTQKLKRTDLHTHIHMFAHANYTNDGYF